MHQKTISKVTGALKDTTKAATKATEKLEEAGPAVEKMVHRAADEIEDTATGVIKTIAIKAALAAVVRMARRRPDVVAGVAFAVGLLGGRFLRTRSRH